MKNVLLYLKDRLTKKEISTFAGLILIVAAPMGWLNIEQVALAKALLTAFGIIDPVTGLAAVSGVGAALVALKEKK